LADAQRLQQVARFLYLTILVRQTILCVSSKVNVILRSGPIHCVASILSRKHSRHRLLSGEAPRRLTMRHSTSPKCNTVFGQNRLVLFCSLPLNPPFPPVNERRPGFPPKVGAFFLINAISQERPQNRDLVASQHAPGGKAVAPFDASGVSPVADFFFDNSRNRPKHNGQGADM